MEIRNLRKGEFIIIGPMRLLLTEVIRPNFPRSSEKWPPQPSICIFDQSSSSSKLSQPKRQNKTRLDNPLHVPSRNDSRGFNPQPRCGVALPVADRQRSTFSDKDFPSSAQSPRLRNNAGLPPSRGSAVSPILRRIPGAPHRIAARPTQDRTRGHRDHSASTVGATIGSREQAGDGQARSRFELIDFPDSNPYPPIEAALPDRAAMPLR